MTKEETPETREVLSTTEDLEDVAAAGEILDRLQVLASADEEAVAPTAVAIHYGLELKLPRGGTAAFLVCSMYQGFGGFLVKGAKPSDEDEDRVLCWHCQTPHYVISLVTALEEGKLDLAEAGSAVSAEAVLAMLLRDAETAAS